MKVRHSMKGRKKEKGVGALSLASPVVPTRQGCTMYFLSRRFSQFTVTVVFGAFNSYNTALCCPVLLYFCPVVLIYWVHIFALFLRYLFSSQDCLHYIFIGDHFYSCLCVRT